MAKLISFAENGFGGPAKEFRSNDPNLIQNGDDFTLNSAIALEGEWTLYSEIGYTGDNIALSASGGPDIDGAFKDPADWNGLSAFHVKSIQHN